MPFPSCSSSQFLATLGILSSSAALLGLLLIVPIILHKAANLRVEIEVSVQKIERRKTGENANAFDLEDLNVHFTVC